MSKPSASAIEGRAIAARPSLRLLAVLAAVCAQLAFAASAQADPPDDLTLTGTTPSSSLSDPASSTTPFINGREDGIIKNVVGFRGARLAPIAAAGKPTNTVSIYTDPKCEGTPVATGTLGQLEGAGIQVEVGEDTATTFYANQTDALFPLEPSDCSSPGITYYQSSTAPPDEEEPPTGGGGGEDPPPGGGTGDGGGTDSGVAPAAPVAPRIHMSPSARANYNTPSVVGSAAGAERVRIFASGRCGGAPIAEVSGAELADGVSVQVPDDSETLFSALSLASGLKSDCSQATSYIEDSTSPRTRITMGPGAKTRRRKAVFRFADINSSDPLSTNFKCRLDRQKWRTCQSPFKVKRLGYRRHVLRIRGTDAVGNFETKPVKRSFKVVRAP
ncbi:MAG TPA: hypothetical protein VI039_13290 [Solirubrobacterales bacterium]